METEGKVWTEAELLALPNEGGKHVLLHGELVMEPGGSDHGYLCVRMLAALERHVSQHRLGVVLESNTGFWMNNGDCLVPDTSFISASRLKGMRRLPKGFFPGAPDLVVEILSLGDTARYIRDKLAIYFQSGTRLAWVVISRERAVRVYDSPADHRLVRLDGILDGGSVVPGFKLSLADLFADLPYA